MVTVAMAWWLLGARCQVVFNYLMWIGPEFRVYLTGWLFFPGRFSSQLCKVRIFWVIFRCISLIQIHYTAARRSRHAGWHRVPATFGTFQIPNLRNADVHDLYFPLPIPYRFNNIRNGPNNNGRSLSVGELTMDLYRSPIETPCTYCTLVIVPVPRSFWK